MSNSQLETKRKLLTRAQREALDQQGFVNLGVLLTPAQIATVCDRITELQIAEGDRAASELLDSPHIRFPKEAGADRLADLVNKGEVFDIFYTHPLLLAAMAHVLGDGFKLSSLNFRSAKPGDGAQSLHVDGHQPSASRQFQVCNSIWLLDDFTPENGATRLVPGTHRARVAPQDVMADPAAPHPDEVLLLAEAGSVIVVNSHTWHGGTRNTTASPRRAIHSYFCHRDQPQQLDQARYLRPETIQRVGAATLGLLGIEATK